MNGMPKTLNSKQDYIYLKDNYPTDVWKPVWRSLIESSTVWMPMGEVDSKEGWFNNDTYKVEESDGKFIQYELKVNENCKMYRIGFTDEEVLSAINEE